MNRRSFLRGLVSGIAITTAEPQWPFRVYSFAKSIIPVNGLTIQQLEQAYHDIVFGYDEPDLIYTTQAMLDKYVIPRLADEIFRPSPIWKDLSDVKVKTTLS